MAKILVVEDEDLLRWSLVKRLTRAGHEVEEAESLARATDCLGHAPPDLLLLDLALPDGHGLDLLERRATHLAGSIIVVLTAVGDAADADQATALGVREFLTKPVAHETLVELIDDLLADR
jgi:two-component system response regulator AtoC